MNPFPRQSGVLLHISSLPGPYGIGEIGDQAYSFVDQFEEMGQRLWQILPLGDTGDGQSPYATTSAFANNPILISFDKLCEIGLLFPNEIKGFPIDNQEKVDFSSVVPLREKILKHVSSQFISRATKKQIKQFESFCEEQESWLNDYALFVSIKKHQGGKKWIEWEEPLSNRDPDTLESAKELYSQEIIETKILQYIFYDQWQNLKSYANKKGISIIGDVPIYISFDSVDVWVNRHLFKLDSNGCMTSQSGCPPDYFQKSGQLWGNPIYKWDAHDKDHYTWWIHRISTLFDMVDIVRIDHFNGLVKYWDVPIGNKTAKNGNWVDGPEDKLFEALFTQLGSKPIIAEDLGEASDEAIPLREKYNIPGMEILQFSFDALMEKKSLELGLHIPKNSVLYTGTHDNDTLIGWINNINPQLLTELEQTMPNGTMSNYTKTLNWKVISYAYESQANMVIVPLQDILGLDGHARMNTPGTINENWEWRYIDNMITEQMIRNMKELTQITDRI